MASAPSPTPSSTSSDSGPSSTSSPPPLLSTIDLLDQQIQSARDEISALNHRLRTLTSHLLTNPPSSIRSLLPTDAKSRPSSTLTPSTLNALRVKHTTHSLTARRATYRLAAGVTTFETRDPNPAAVDGGRVMGVRIEVFSAAAAADAQAHADGEGEGKGRFLVPYYLLLNRPSLAARGGEGEEGEGEGEGKWCLHRHTFPPFVPVKEICRRWLPKPGAMDQGGEEDNAGAGGGGVRAGRDTQDLKRLAMELRRRVVSYHRREDAVAKMGSANSELVSRITLPDAEILEARVYLKDGSVVNIRMDGKGRIEKVVAKDQVGRRLYALERRVKQMERIERVRFVDG